MQQLGNFKVTWMRFFDEKSRPVTVSQVFDKESRLISTAKAICSQEEFQVDREVGRKVSMAKALLSARAKHVIDKTERTKIWEDYRTKMTKKPRW